MPAIKDILQRFIFEETSIRGEVVHLDNTWSAVLAKHPYPPVARELLGEALAASALLAATLKLDGSLTMQITGDGPVSLVIAECSSKRTLRGLVNWDKEQSLEAAPLEQLISNGKMVITLERNAGERYQGIVELKGESLSAALGEYLQRSEQLDTHLWLAVDKQRATGLLVQRLPGYEEDADQDGWNRTVTLAETIKAEELLTLSCEEIIHRLFSEEDIRLLDSEPMRFECSCTRERVANMLISLGQQEINEVLEDQGIIAVNCQFCNHLYEFDKVDAEQLFVEEGGTFNSPTVH